MASQDFSKYPNQPGGNNLQYPGPDQPYPPQPYPGQPYPGQAQPGYYPQQVAPAPVIILANKSYLNFTGAIVLSCFVYWCCGCLFGLIAFILAMVGQSQAASGDRESASCNLKASYILSIVGVAIGTIAIIVLIALAATGNFNYNYKYYSYNNNCYLNGVRYDC